MDRPHFILPFPQRVASLLGFDRGSFRPDQTRQQIRLQVPQCLLSLRPMLQERTASGRSDRFFAAFRPLLRAPEPI